MTSWLSLLFSSLRPLGWNGRELHSTPNAQGGVEWCAPPIGVHNAPTPQHLNLSHGRCAHSFSQ